MDRCKHVGRLRLAQDHSILNPQKWCCLECSTTESAWACLKCSHVACGRYIEDHALKHFEETGHPLAMEVRDLYVFCYLCKDYVLNDNPEGDLKLLRSSLLAVQGQKQDQPARRGRMLRSTAAGEDMVPPQRTPQERWELQLKGAGPTPFSRQADGRKVLRSSIREFLCSEAMFHLGIPTTRAGACVTSESTVIRDVFYDGNPKYEKCTVVLRIAPTFIRFGSFEIFKPPDEYTGRAGPSVGRNDIRVQMLDYVISSFYPEIQAAHTSDSDNIQRNAAFFREVTRRTARMVAEWQCVGFCHGVLNTDNMSIVGLTIDYGPFGFLDRYDPDHVCNASDNAGRYTYSKQPQVCKWNLQKLAEALEPELPLALGEAILAEEFDSEFQRHYLQKMRKKLGLIRVEQEEDGTLVAKLLETMHLTGADFTNTFYMLSSFPTEPSDSAEFITRLTSQCASLEELRLAFRPQMDPRQLSMMLMLAQSNPQLFALIGTQANVTKELERVEQQSRLEQLSPAELQSRNTDHWETWLQKYRARLDKEKEGVGDTAAWQAERMRIMHANNPKYVLRNYIAQNAIEAAENGDFSEVRRVLKLLESPYYSDTAVTEATGPEAVARTTDEQCSYSSRPPLWAAELCVT